MSRPAADYAKFSAVVALLVLALKLFAWRLSGSVGLLSDALETLTNLAGALMALSMLRIAALPADAEHAYGHSKAEYFSAGLEGLLIFGASIAIIIESIRRLLAPQPIESAAISLAVAGVATALNFGAARLLAIAGRRLHSVSLDADARHLMTDVWTTLGVIVGVAMVAVTGWLWLDAVVALAVAANVTREGYALIRESADGLMDAALPPPERARILAVLDRFRCEAGADTVKFHAVRTRRSASRRFISLHVLVPGAWSVQQGHDLVERLERALTEALPRLTVFSHLEPVEDPSAYDDDPLEPKP